MLRCVLRWARCWVLSTLLCVWVRVGGYLCECTKPRTCMLLMRFTRRPARSKRNTRNALKLANENAKSKILLTSERGAPRRECAVRCVRFVCAVCWTPSYVCALCVCYVCACNVCVLSVRVCAACVRATYERMTSVPSSTLYPSER